MGWSLHHWIDLVVSSQGRHFHRRGLAELAAAAAVADHRRQTQICRKDWIPAISAEWRASGYPREISTVWTGWILHCRKLVHLNSVGLAWLLLIIGQTLVITIVHSYMVTQRCCAWYLSIHRVSVYSSDHRCFRLVASSSEFTLFEESLYCLKRCWDLTYQWCMMCLDCYLD